MRTVRSSEGEGRDGAGSDAAVLPAGLTFLS